MIEWVGSDPNISNIISSEERPQVDQVLLGFVDYISTQFLECFRFDRIGMSCYILLWPSLHIAGLCSMQWPFRISPLPHVTGVLYPWLCGLVFSLVLR